MRIVIDMQGAQSESRYRGIGRYSLSLSLAIARHRGQQEVILALNGAFPETIDPIRDAFDGILPQSDIRVWDAPGPTRETNPRNRRFRDVAEHMREAFILAQQPDVVLITSLFEGLADDAITSIGRFDCTTPTAVILYDLIPLLAPDEHYQTSTLHRDYYQRKFSSLKRARLLLAISDSAKREAHTALNFSEQDVVNISCAYDASFRPLELTDAQRQDVRRRAGITKPFVMYTGGADERKNLHRLIQAYAALPAQLRAGHQLVFVGKMPAAHVEAFFRTAKTHGLDANELVVAGYVTDEDLVKLYNVCDLFVFPSTHEGFGIPPLEAMSCRAPVIGSHATSLPEVIGLADAMFDPASVDAIRNKLERALTDTSFRERLIEHGIAHSRTFTWAHSAERALAALQRFGKPGAHRGSAASTFQSFTLFDHIRKKILVIKLDHLGDFVLAIPALTRLKARYPHSSIDVVLGSGSAPIATSLNLFSSIHTFDFFKTRSSESASATERDVRDLLGRLESHYDIAIDFRRQGDSRFLLARVNATTKVGYETFDPLTDDCLQVVLKSHPDTAFEATSLNETSISLQMMRLVDALPASPNDYVSLPELREAPTITAAATTSTGIALFPKAGNDVKEWSQQNYLGLIRLLLEHPMVDAVNVYFANDPEARAFGLTAHSRLHVHAGLAFQPLCQSLGTNVMCIANNSFGAHLASYLGLAVIAIYGGHETPSEWAPVFHTAYVIHYPVPCSPCHIAHRSDCAYALRCLTEISVDMVYSKIREALSEIAANRIAGKPATAIRLTENKGAVTLMKDLLWSIAGLGIADMAPAERLRIAECAAFNHPPVGRHLFVDVSEFAQRDARSGIQRVVRSVLRVMLSCPPAGFAVVPVYATVDQLGYRRASRFTREFLGDAPEGDLVDEPIFYAAGDIYLGLDLHPQIIRAQRQYFHRMRARGVRVKFVVFDMLCVTMPQHFPSGFAEAFTEWLQIVTENDGAICISKTVAGELREWIEQHGPARGRRFAISHFHLGADIKGSVLGDGLSDAERQQLRRLAKENAFLMVGTLEPRKGHAYALSAFEHLWSEGVGANLIIVGKEGWLVDSLVKRLEKHARAGKPVSWVQGASDEFLAELYASSRCLVVPSEGEGFGLPLIEAAHHQLPIIARDLPVFREVAGEHAYYFSGDDPLALADAIRQWLVLRQAKQHPGSAGMSWLTWQQSAEMLMACACAK